MSTLKLQGALCIAALCFAACSDNDDTQAPTIQKGDSILISPYDTLAVHFSEDIKKPISSQINLADSLKYKVANGSTVQIFGKYSFLGHTDAATAPVFAQMPANQDFTIEFTDIEDGSGNRTPFDTLKFSTLPLIDSPNNDKISTPDTLVKAGEFIYPTQSENTLHFAGMLRGNFTLETDQVDYFALELKVNTKVNISLKNYRENLKLVFKGPVLPSQPVEDQISPFWNEPKTLETKEYPANRDYVNADGKDSISLEAFLDGNRQAIGLTDSDPLGTPLVYWVEVRFVEDAEEGDLQISPYELEIKIER